MYLSCARNLLRLKSSKKFSALLMFSKRNTTFDSCTDKIGNREIVGYGWNGCPCYADRFDYPMPAIRFREATAEICQLREKEQADWRKLTIDDKKELYRYSFCQTFAEMKAPTGEWKFALATGIWATVLGLLLSYSYYFFLYGDLPDTFEESRRQAQLKRIIALEVNPITGIASKWDYENDTWK